MSKKNNNRNNSNHNNSNRNHNSHNNGNHSNSNYNNSNYNSGNNQPPNVGRKIVIFFLILAVGFAAWYALRSDSDSEKQTSNEVTQISDSTQYTFRNDSACKEHYEKHGIDMGYDSKEDYANGADKVLHSKDALQKTEKEDGDAVFYLEKSNEFVILSTDGYIRTYFEPEDGIAYYNRQ